MVRGLQVAGLALVALFVVSRLSTGAASTDYRATGDPRPLPREQLTPVTADELGGILVGLEGEPVVVNLWASWCPPCRAEMPLLERAAGDYAGRVVFLGVATNDSPSAAADFLDEVGVTYPNVFDATGDVRRDMGLRGYPTTYVFDPTGELVDTVVGGITEPRLAAQLDDLVT